MKRLLSLLLLLFLTAAFAAAARAQTAAIRGSVRDAAGTPLPGANVVLEGTGAGAAAGADGRYRIDRIPPGTYTITASALGFQTEQRVVAVADGGVQDVDFVLREHILQSGEVVVTASRRAQQTTLAPMSLSVLLPREIEARNSVTLDDALRYLPGVQLAGNQVNVRGSSGFSYNVGSRVLLLVDGVSLLGPDTGGIPFDALPMSQVERIEVVKGPGSALYGGNALGGVINVLTKDFPDAPETAVRLYGGGYEPVRYPAWRAAWAGADAPRMLGGLALTHARRLSERWGVWMNLAYRADAGYLRSSDQTMLLAHAKVGGYLRPNLRLDVLGGFTRRKADLFLYWNGLEDVLSPGSLAIGGTEATGTNDDLATRLSLLPTLTHLFNPTLFLTVKGRFYRNANQPLDSRGRPRSLSEGTVAYQYGSELQLDWNPAPQLYVAAGLTADGSNARSSFYVGEDRQPARDQPQGAAFAQAEVRLSERLHVTGGLRFDAYRIDTRSFAHQLSPKLNALFAASPLTSLRAAFGRGFRVPSMAERFANNQDFLPIVPNLGLRPEESTGYEVGLRSLLPLPGRGGALLDVAFFWNDYRRLVEPTFIESRAAFQFVNLTRARIRGLEASVEAASPDERRALRLSYTLLDADDLTEDRPLVFRSRHLFKSAVTLRAFGPVEVGVDYRYASRPERLDSDFSRFVPDADRMIAAHVLDARLAGRWTRIRLALIVKNALEYYYVERPALLASPRQFILQMQVTL